MINEDAEAHSSCRKTLKLAKNCALVKGPISRSVEKYQNHGWIRYLQLVPYIASVFTECYEYQQDPPAFSKVLLLYAATFQHQYVLHC